MKTSNKNILFVSELLKKAGGESRPNFSGSFTLGALLSTSGGLLFLLLFLNLTRYVLAVSAVEQATTTIMRCLTPSDPQCVVQESNESTQELDWFQRNTIIHQTAWADRYNYSAELKQQIWEAKFQGYEIHKVRPPQISWTTRKLPRRTFSPRLNNYEYRYLSLQANIETPENPSDAYYAPNYEPNFPDFDNEYERENQNLPQTSWQPIGSSADSSIQQKLSLQFKKLHFEPQRISSGSVKLFQSKVITIPELPDSNTLACQDSSTNPCSISEKSGGKGSWNSHASMAIKVFSKVRKSNGQSSALAPKAKWGQENDGPGLQITIWEPAQNGQSSASQTICLGGRDWSSPLGNNWSNYNLWLRGPKGSNGGQFPACPDGKREHWPIEVPRGGKFQITGWISAAMAQGDIDAEVDFFYYFDDYELKHRSGSLKKNSLCSGKIKLTPDNDENEEGNEENCPVRKICSLGVGAQVGKCETKIIREPLCLDTEEATQDKSAYPLPLEYCVEKISAVVCDHSWRPIQTASCAEIPDTRSVCGWEAITTVAGNEADFISLDNVTSDCSSAVTQQNSTSCGHGKTSVIYDANGNYGNPGLCPAVEQLVKDSELRTQEINTNQPTGAIQFAPLNAASFTWLPPEEFSPPQWDIYSSVPPEVARQNIDTNTVRAIDAVVESNQIIYKHLDSSWRPELSAFGVIVDANNQKTSAAIEYKLIKELAVTLDSAYPFKNKPEFEISEIIPNTNTKEACSGLPANLENRLRHYASRHIAEAANPDIWFKGEAKYVDSIKVIENGSCSEPNKNINIQVPTCSKLSHRYLEELECGPGLYLGRYTIPNIPSECASGDCISRQVINSFQDTAPTLKFNSTKAKLRGFQELQRSFPGAKLDCSSDGCFNAQIIADDQNPISVQAVYHLPLSFPLNTIIGRSNIQISRYVQEVSELSVSGRFESGIKWEGVN